MFWGTCVSWLAFSFHRALGKLLQLFPLQTLIVCYNWPKWITANQNLAKVVGVTLSEVWGLHVCCFVVTVVSLKWWVRELQSSSVTWRTDMISSNRKYAHFCLCCLLAWVLSADLSFSLYRVMDWWRLISIDIDSVWCFCNISFSKRDAVVLPTWILTCMSLFMCYLHVISKAFRAWSRDALSSVLFFKVLFSFC